MDRQPVQALGAAFLALALAACGGESGGGAGKTSGNDSAGGEVTGADAGGSADAALPSPDAIAGISEQKSGKARTLQPGASPADLEAVAAGNNSLGLDLYGQLRSQPGNLMFSPWSVTSALAMTWAGARENTEKEMAATLHFSLPQAKLHPALNALSLELKKRAEGKKGQDGGKFRLNVANSLWGQKDYAFLPAFLDLLAESYGAGMHLVDFAAKTEEARLAINAWVEAMTEGKIKDLIPAGVLDSMTRLVLVNAIYFNAAWAEPFDEKLTKDEVFHLLDGKEIKTPTMHVISGMTLGSGAGWQAVGLPYDGKDLEMVVILPEANKLAEFEGKLDGAMLASVFAALQPAVVDLALPRFGYTWATKLKEAFQALGMSDAFTFGKADFSGMDGKKELFIGQVLHKSFIKVNEAGTEAAAATAVVMEGGTSQPPPPKPFVVDRPFLYLIRDLPTGTVLFLGRVVDPTK